MPAGRPTTRDRHPALLAARVRGYSEEVAKLDEEELSGLQAWESFNPQEKKFLALLPYYHSAAATCEALGVNKNWYQVRMQKNAYFKQAYKTRQWTSVKIARYMALDMLGMAVMSHMRAVDPENPDKVDHKTRFEYIRLLYQVTGITKNDGAGLMPAGNTFINTQNVAMFGSNKADRSIVDGLPGRPEGG